MKAAISQGLFGYNQNATAALIEDKIGYFVQKLPPGETLTKSSKSKTE